MNEHNQKEIYQIGEQLIMALHKLNDPEMFRPRTDAELYVESVLWEMIGEEALAKILREAAYE